jgi:hypothetical protein
MLEPEAGDGVRHETRDRISRAGESEAVRPIWCHGGLWIGKADRQGVAELNRFTAPPEKAAASQIFGSVMMWPHGDVVCAAWDRKRLRLGLAKT